MDCAASELPTPNASPVTTVVKTNEITERNTQKTLGPYLLPFQAVGAGQIIGSAEEIAGTDGQVCHRAPDRHRGWVSWHPKASQSLMPLAPRIPFRCRRTWPNFNDSCLPFDKHTSCRSAARAAAKVTDIQELRLVQLHQSPHHLPPSLDRHCWVVANPHWSALHS